MADVLDILRERGLLEDTTTDALPSVLNSPVTVYAGFDPTAASLAIGNYVTIMVLAHFQRCGHRVVALVGGATGMIGDPSGKSAERNLLSRQDIERNVEGIRENLSRFLDFDHPTAPAILVNNADWLGKFTFLDFLRDVGKHFRIGSMLGKDTVRTRLESDSGMSFTEFSYPLLQAYDFLHLFDAHGCTLQAGGSDQWGNITAGVDLIRRLRGEEAYGLTFPLVCDASGQKFGKSEGNAIYLDHGMTSYYAFYQFFLRVTDADVIRLLRVFTFLPMEEIEALETSLRETPEERRAQRRLAEEVTKMVHGEAGLAVARRASEVLFGGALDGISADDLLGIFADVPSVTLKESDVVGEGVLSVAASSGLCGSRGEARRLVQNHGLYINNDRVEAVDACVSAEDLIEGRLLVLRSGRKRFHLVKVSDAADDGAES